MPDNTVLVTGSHRLVGKATVVGYEYSLTILIATIAQFFLGGGTAAMTKDS